MRTIAYFDIFHYPLTAEEVLFFMDQEAVLHEVEAGIQSLVTRGCLHRLGAFYSLNSDQSLAERRTRGNQHAGKLLHTGRNISRMLYQFPFVRGIGISGSLSKNFADKDADIDYFIITRSGRLWIARTLLHLYKKLTIFFGKEGYYCMNYFIDEQALEIGEKNLFTAMELITLAPTCGNGVLTHFFQANEWVADYMPHYIRRARTADYARNSLLKRTAEWLLDNRLGDRLDDLFHRITRRRWGRKESTGAKNAKGLNMSLHTGKHYARPNPGMLQRKILTVYEDKLKQLEQTWRLPLLSS